MDSLHSFLRLRGYRVYCITGLSGYPDLRNGSDNMDSPVRERRSSPNSNDPHFPLYFEVLTLLKLEGQKSFIVRQGAFIASTFPL